MPKKSDKDYYAVLGVKPDASPEDIKAAYRRRSRQSHPDKSGSHDEQVDLNAAYDCLSDPSRRLLYDQTGCDNDQSFEQEVNTVLMNEFATALDSDSTLILKAVRDSLRERKQTIGLKRGQTLAAESKFVGRRDKVKTKEGITNLYLLVINRQLQTIRAGLALLDRQEKLIDAALKELDNYESDEEMPRYVMPRNYLITTLPTNNTVA